MLYYSTIESKTLELLKNLISIPQLANLRLVGGTSLALQIGHRKSIDIDLFGGIDPDLRLDLILKEIGPLKIIKRSPHIFICTINDIKVDIVNYSYPWLDTQNTIDTIPLASRRDIAAMKLSAITGRGTKKDFIDLYFLLKEFTLEEILHFYQEKYADGAVFLVIRSLAYFADADKEAMPKMIIPLDWLLVKNTIISALNDYMKG
jgi:hypothetical protein